MSEIRDIAGTMLNIIDAEKLTCAGRTWMANLRDASLRGLDDPDWTDAEVTDANLRGWTKKAKKGAAKVICPICHLAGQDEHSSAIHNAYLAGEHAGQKAERQRCMNVALVEYAYWLYAYWRDCEIAAIRDGSAGGMGAAANIVEKILKVETPT